MDQNNRSQWFACNDADLRKAWAADQRRRLWRGVFWSFVILGLIVGLVCALRWINGPR